METEKEIEEKIEIAEETPEKSEFQSKTDAKFAEMDAVVDAFIAEIYGADEKSAENTLKKESINANQSQSNSINANQSQSNSINANQSQLCTGERSKLAKKSHWFFPGEVIRVILRSLTTKQIDLCREMQISTSTFNRLLKRDAVPTQVAKFIAGRLGLNTPEELWEYYEQVPESVREAIKYDMRISRPITGIPLSTDVYRAAIYPLPSFNICK